MKSERGFYQIVHHGDYANGFRTKTTNGFGKEMILKVLGWRIVCGVAGIGTRLGFPFLEPHESWVSKLRSLINT